MTLLNIVLLLLIFLNLSTVYSFKGGSVGKISDAPYMVAIKKLDGANSTDGKKTRTFTIVCGGTIVSSSFILSAAHCYHQKLSPRRYRITTNCLKSVHTGQCGNILKVDRILFHPAFDHPMHDVALLRTEQEIHLTSRAKVMKVAPFKGGSYKKCIITGYGPNSPDSVLTKAYPSIKKDEECTKLQNLRGDMDTFMCTDEITGLEFSDEDGGGPLVCHSEPPKPKRDKGIGKGKVDKLKKLATRQKFVPGTYVVGIILGTYAPGGYLRTSGEYEWIAKTANLRGSRIDISVSALALSLFLSLLM